MALIKLNIRVDDVCTLLEDFNFILIERADSQYGSYSEITKSGTRPRLQSDVYSYEYKDTTGSEYYWYRWRFYHTGTGDVSVYSRPTQGAETNSKYISLSDVKRILMTGERRIKFSDAYKNIRPDRDNDQASTIELASVSFHPDFVGVRECEIEFTSATNFKISITEDRRIEPTSIGTGDVNTNFTSNDNMIFISTDDWSGTAVTGDKIVFDTEANMSTYSALKFLRDAELFVDMILEANLQYLEAKDLEHRFAVGSVPKAVEFAVSRFAAFFIYTTVYNEQQIAGLPNSINDITVGAIRQHDLSSWPHQAMKALDSFIAKYQMFFDPESGASADTAPKWWHSDTLFDAKGVAYVGEGIKLPDVDTFKDRSEQSWDGLLDWDLMMPGASSIYTPTYVNREEVS